MFQTWPIEAVQSIGNEWLTAFFVAWTALGYRSVFVPLLIVAIFAWDLRRGFWWTQCILFTALVTVAAKSIFEMPRPYQVSEAVQLLDPWLQVGDSAHRGFGFPSGHASMAVVIWGGLAAMLSRPAARAAALAVGTAVVVSRLYLGVHFIGDLLGGLAIGACGWWLFRRILRSASAPTGVTGPWIRGEIGGPMPVYWYWAGILLPCLLLPWVPLDTLATWWGLHLGFHLAFRSGGVTSASPDPGPRSRTVAVVVAFALFAATGWLAEGPLTTLLASLANPGAGATAAFVAGFAPAFAMMLGATTIRLRSSAANSPPAA